MQRSIEEARNLLGEGGPALALTGAGISAECGIPPFRGPGGLWDRFPPEEYATAVAFRRDPAKVWRMLREILQAGRDVEPGAGHLALADLEEKGRLAGVITQNVDGLHQRAGSREVVELHGSGRELFCVSCGLRQPAEEADLEALPPRCASCEGVLRPDVVLFGEMLDQEVMERARRLLASCRSLLVVGTSCEVAPASLFPEWARTAGAAVIEVNPAETSLTPRADLSLRGTAGEILPTL